MGGMIWPPVEAAASTCKLGGIAGLFHHGDGDGAGGDGVADRGAGNHTAQSRGYDRDLCRAAGGSAGYLICKVDEELCDAGALKERAEDDKYDNELSTDVYRGADNAAGAVKQRVDHTAEHTLEIHALGEHAPERVHEQCAGDAQDGNADASAAQLDKGENADYADNSKGRGHLRCAREHLDDSVKIKCVIEEAGCTDDHDDPVKPRDVVFPDVVLAHGVVQKTHDGYAAEEDHEADLKRGIAPQGGIDAVEREKSHDELDDPLGNSGPYTGVRLAVVFFHDLVNFCRRNGLKLAECRRAVNFYLVRRSFGSRRILFLEQGHTRTILSFRCFVELRGL